MNWQPIETAPKDQTVVSLFVPDLGILHNYVRVVGDGENNVYYDPVEDGYVCVREATHWMKIEPPKEKKCLTEVIDNIAGHIKQPYTLPEILEKISIGDYNAELMLQHLLLVVKEMKEEK